MTDATQDEMLVCERHGTPTSLRCNRCEKPICVKCAVQTPTGYRCRDCVRGQQKVFNTAQPVDYVVGSIAGGFLSFIGGLIIPNLWIIFIIIAAPFAGGLIAEAVRRAVSRRRSKTLFQVVTGMVFIAGMLPTAGVLFPLLMALAGGLEGVSIGEALAVFGFDLLWQLIYAGVTAYIVYYRLTGIQIGR